MLKKLLSPKVCASCLGCCIFDNSDLWEMPLFLPELVERINSSDSSYKNTVKFKYNKFSYELMPPKLHGDELYICPFLGKDGCVLGDDKPFDCKIWPFRLMYDKDKNIRIAVAKYCREVASMPFEKLKNFLLSERLYEKITDYGKINPPAIKNYSEDYIMII